LILRAILRGILHMIGEQFIVGSRKCF